MENEINQEVVDLGSKAKRIRDNQDFKDVVEHIYEKMFRQFRKTNIANAAEREDLHKLTYAVEYFEHTIQKMVEAAEYEIKTHEDDAD
jgi:hypothetical protein